MRKRSRRACHGRRAKVRRKTYKQRERRVVHMEKDIVVQAYSQWLS